LEDSWRSAVAALESAASEPDNVPTGVVRAVNLLCRHFDAVSLGGSDPTLGVLLADTTREVPFWRGWFGLSGKASAHGGGGNVDDETTPDCVLEVARRVMARAVTGQAPNEQVRSALRLMANCCADDDVNRSVVVRRGGVEALMGMADERQECDLVIPTLYNVCVDYDEPAVDGQGKILGPPLLLRQQQTNSESAPILNAAEQRLGMFWNPDSQRTSVEILVEMAPHVPHHLWGTLADLVEMASRVALYGLHALCQSREGYVIPTVATDVVDALTSRGFDIAAQTGCGVSICQAVLNVFSQKQCHEAVLTVDGGLWRLIHLPYACQDDDDDDDAGELPPYRKEFLKLVYEISGVEDYAEHVTPNSRLIRDCVESLGNDDGSGGGGHTRGGTPSPQTALSASMCVLVANAVTSTERAAQLTQTTPIASAIQNLLARSSDPEILVPAIDLTTRLALCREGQDGLHSAKMMAVIPRHLLVMTGDVDAKGVEVRRDTVTLARLMIKGRPEWLSDLAWVDARHDDQSTIAAVMSLFHRTNDARTKTEIGRFCVEVLRTYFSTTPQTPTSAEVLSSPFSSDGVMIDRPDRRQQSDADFLSLISPTAPKTAPTVADPMAYIITNLNSPAAAAATSQPRLESGSPHDDPSVSAAAVQAEAGAWFGLGLLSNFPSARPWIASALARDGFGPLKRLEEVAQGQQPTAAGEGASAPDTAALGTHKDPRHENVKVVVVKMLQTETPPVFETEPRQTPQAKATAVGVDGSGLSAETAAKVRQGLEAAAAAMGVVDWVLV
jgi:hypothetical protein